MAEAAARAEWTLPEPAAKELGVNPKTFEILPKEKTEPKEQPAPEKATRPEDHKNTESDESKKAESPDGQPKPDEEKSEDEKKNPYPEQALKMFTERLTDEQKQEQFIKDFENWEKFTASNTRKAMELNNLAKMLGTEDISKTLEEMSTDEFNEFLVTADEWFGDKGKNPVRRIVDAWKTKSPALRQYVEEKDNEIKESELLDFREELVSLYEVAPQYKKEEKLAELVKFADENGFTLLQANKFVEAQEGSNKAVDLTKQLDELTKKNQEEISKYKKELKERNEELKKLRETAPINLISPGASGGGVAEVKFSNARPGNFDETERNLKKQLGIT